MPCLGQHRMLWGPEDERARIYCPRGHDSVRYTGKTKQAPAFALHCSSPQFDHGGTPLPYPLAADTSLNGHVPTQHPRLPCNLSGVRGDSSTSGMTAHFATMEPEALHSSAELLPAQSRSSSTHKRGSVSSIVGVLILIRYDGLEEPTAYIFGWQMTSRW